MKNPMMMMMREKWKLNPPIDMVKRKKKIVWKKSVQTLIFQLLGSRDSRDISPTHYHHVYRLIILLPTLFWDLITISTINIFSLPVKMYQMQLAHTKYVFLNENFLFGVFCFFYSSCLCHRFRETANGKSFFYPCQQMKWRTRKINNACQKLIQQWHINVEKREKFQEILSLQQLLLFVSLSLLL